MAVKLRGEKREEKRKAKKKKREGTRKTTTAISNNFLNPFMPNFLYVVKLHINEIYRCHSGKSVKFLLFFTAVTTLYQLNYFKRADCITFIKYRN